jgi:hypothetical protein
MSSAHAFFIFLPMPRGSITKRVYINSEMLGSPFKKDSLIAKHILFRIIIIFKHQINLFLAGAWC